jgi:hypothetical protein
MIDPLGHGTQRSDRNSLGGFGSVGLRFLSPGPGFYIEINYRKGSTTGTQGLH